MFKEIDDDHVECQLCDKKILVAWRANHLKKSHPDLTIAGGLDKSKDASNVKIKSEPGIATNTFFKVINLPRHTLHLEGVLLPWAQRSQGTV